MSRYFSEQDKNKLLQTIEHHPLGILTTIQDGFPVSIHLPFVLTEHSGEFRLLTHIFLRNEILNYIDNQPLSIVFTGVQGYVSPRLSPSLTAVPTWNYVAVYVQGKGKLLNDRKEKEEILVKMIEALEPDWLRAFKQLPESYLGPLYSAIAGIEITVTSLSGTTKLSQDRTPAHQDNIIKFMSSSNNPMEVLLGEKMRQELKK